MSLGAKITLGGAVIFTSAAVYYVHYKQEKDRESMREGVIKDLERQALKAQNIKDLQVQIELTKLLEAQRARDLENSKLSELKENNLK